MKLTKENFKELLLTIMAGVWIRSSVAEMKGKDFKDIEKWEEYFAEMAKKLGYEELAELFQGKSIPHNNISLESEKEVEEYNNDTFWYELEIRLGKRDFYNDITEEELKKINKQHWLPKKVHKYYQKYRREFEKYGIERLKIIKDKKREYV